MWFMYNLMISGCNGVEGTPDMTPPVTHSVMDQSAPVLHLSQWRPLPSKVSQLRVKMMMPNEGALSERALGVVEGQSLGQVVKLLRSFPTTSLSTSSPLPQRSYFCLTAAQEIYLANYDNESPALKFDSSPLSTDSLALFIFDIDAPISGPLDAKNGSRGSAPVWINVTPPTEVPSYLIKRAPFLLWAVDDLDRQLTEIPAGLGGIGVSLKGKSPHRVRFGRPWYNDYSTWFTSRAISGKYYGYDGPCVSWNDPLPHHRIWVLLLSLKHPLQIPDYAISLRSASGWNLLSRALLEADAYATGIWRTQKSLDMMPPLFNVRP